MWPVWCLLLAIGSLSARAEDGPLDGEFAVHSASVVDEAGVLQLDALIQYPLNEQIRTALHDGVTLSFEVDVSVSRHRRLWFAEQLQELQLTRELSYHVVSDRYVVREPDSEQQQSFATLEAALEQLGRIEHQPVMVTKQLHGGPPYDVSVRAGIRRGRLSAALRVLAFWSGDWYRTSPWYTWTLPQ
ncbi:MAG: DUF4390 domain-containing protein [Steroidobacteraceae bacterium]